MYRFFFLRHGLLSILVAPEIISGDYWGAARDEWRLGNEMYLSVVFEGSSGRRVAGVEFFSSRSMDRESLYIFLFSFFCISYSFRVQNLITKIWGVCIRWMFFLFLFFLEEWSFSCELDESLTHQRKRKQRITCGWKQIENGEPFPQVSWKLMPVENFE